MQTQDAKLQTESECFTAVTTILQQYFEGLYYGDVDKLNKIFHPDAWLKAPNSRRSLTQWLTDVAQREAPGQLGHDFNFKILALDIVQNQAMAKIACPLFDFNYVDFLGLLKENGQWRIVTKMYTDIGFYDGVNER